jgi:hypothetical protein
MDSKIFCVPLHLVFFYIHINTIKSMSNSFENTVKPVYKGHSMEPENVAFMSSCPLYTG